MIKQTLKNGLFWLNSMSVTLFCRVHYRKQAEGYCKRNNIKHTNSAYEKDIKNYWKRFGQNVSPVFGRWYAGCNGIEDARYIPEDLFYDKIERYFNNIDLEQAYVDKGMYGRLFPDVRQPETVVANVNGILYDSTYRIIHLDDAIAAILQEDAFIIKPTRDSGGGKNVQLVKNCRTPQHIRQLIQTYGQDFIIQKPLKQHKDLAKIHKESINTIRVMSHLRDDGVHIVSSVFRIGVGSACVDNECSGGINCGINPDGTLSKVAYDGSGRVYLKHPQGMAFSEVKIPHYADVLEVITKQHQKLPHFRLISWDFTVSEEGVPVMIELNLRWQGLNFHQLHHGPLFGSDTDEILNGIFTEKERS